VLSHDIRSRDLKLVNAIIPTDIRIEAERREVESSIKVFVKLGCMRLYSEVEGHIHLYLEVEAMCYVDTSLHMTLSHVTPFRVYSRASAPFFLHESYYIYTTAFFVQHIRGVIKLFRLVKREKELY
jgi:hypothetical protein